MCSNLLICCLQLLFLIKFAILIEHPKDVARPSKHDEVAKQNDVADVEQQRPRRKRCHWFASGSSGSGAPPIGFVHPPLPPPPPGAFGRFPPFMKAFGGDFDSSENFRRKFEKFGGIFGGHWWHSPEFWNHNDRESEFDNDQEEEDSEFESRKKIGKFGKNFAKLEHHHRESDDMESRESRRKFGSSRWSEHEFDNEVEDMRSDTSNEEEEEVEDHRRGFMDNDKESREDRRRVAAGGYKHGDQLMSGFDQEWKKKEEEEGEEEEEKKEEEFYSEEEEDEEDEKEVKVHKEEEEEEEEDGATKKKIALHKRMIQF